MAEKKENIKKSNKGKYILVGLVVVALLGGTAYYFKSRSKAKGGSLLPEDLKDFEEELKVETAAPQPRVSSGGSSAGFPLKRGSHGETVKKIQKLLIQKYGTAVLPKFGADGVWGSEMESAMIAKGIPNNISEDMLTKWTAAGVINLSGLGEVLCDQIRSVVPVRVWNSKGAAVNVPRGTILGEFIEGKNGVTKFRTVDGNILFTNTICICYV